MTRNKLPVQQQTLFKLIINKEQQETSLLILNNVNIRFIIIKITALSVSSSVARI